MPKSYVSMGMHICPICGKKHEANEILLDRRIKDSLERETITGYGLCEECKKNTDKGYVALVSIDAEKSETNPDGTINISSAYRTGKLLFLRKEVASKMFNAEIKTEMVFVDDEVINHIEKSYQEQSGEGN